MAQSKKQIIQDRKAAVGYRDKAVTCSGCAHFRTTPAPIVWMVKDNERIAEMKARGEYTWREPRDLSLPGNQKQAKPRCERQGAGPLSFPVKRGGTCQEWAQKIS